MAVDKENQSVIEEIPSEKQHLTLYQTCFGGMRMGLIAYNLSFSIVPLGYTVTALIFGNNSLITILTVSFSQLIAGYVHTHASRTGIASSTQNFGGFYISKLEMRNRRLYEEKPCSSLQRYFCTYFLNAFVLNMMWQTFTICYILQTILFLYFKRILLQIDVDDDDIETFKTLEICLIIIQGFTRYLAGCLAGTFTGLINHLWQWYLAHDTEHYPIRYNTDAKKLKLKCSERKELLSPLNEENWIKAFSMLFGALFFILISIPNPTGFHLFSLPKKRFITDILVINGGWLYFRDTAMLLFKTEKKQKKSPSIPLNIDQSKPLTIDSQIIEDEQSKMLV